jgi:uncharacterized delta-60 repeat protein
MWNWFSRLAPKQRTYRARRYVRPHLEALEARYCPSGGSLDWSDPTGGLLDPTFGSGGEVMTSFTNNYDAAYSVTAQPDGKILIGGNNLVARYNANGTPDASFGSGGYITTAFGSTNAVALQPQANGTSKILAAGGTSSKVNGDFAVARYNADGTLDTTFGKKGQAGTNLGGTIGSEESMVVDSAGRILVAGYTNATGAGYTAALVRYNANGSLDTTFGSGGKLITSIQDQNSGKIDSVALQSDGKIVLADCGTDPSKHTQIFEVARFNTNGTLDSTFGTGGVVTTLVGGEDSFGGLAIQGDGKIVVAGVEIAGVNSVYPFYLVRYNTDGTLDNTFGSSGVVSLTNPPGIMPTPYGVAVQSDGSIVVGGDMGDPVTQENVFFAVRVSSSGALETSYGDGGAAWVDTGYYGEARAGIALQPDGALLVAGYEHPTTNYRPVDVALVRFLGAAPVIGSFTANPNPVASGSNVTLTASNITDGNPNSSITQVTFCYLDANGNPVVLGTGTEDSSGNWELTLAINLPPGTYTLYAQAQDNYGALGNIAALTLTVQ